MAVNGDKWYFLVCGQEWRWMPRDGLWCFCGCWYGKGMERTWRCGFVCFLAYAARLDVFVVLF
jgi:hypothetical protein